MNKLSEGVHYKSKQVLERIDSIIIQNNLKVPM
jgi:hypothetical protein